jgi:hypothetical protein
MIWISGGFHELSGLARARVQFILEDMVKHGLNDGRVGIVALVKQEAKDKTDGQQNEYWGKLSSVPDNNL